MPGHRTIRHQLGRTVTIYESAKIKPAVVQVEAHPYLPETDLLEFCKARARENLDISALPEDALDEINQIQTRQRFNEVVKTGSPGFIPQGR
jgi:diketogulonate reductase-like aldo/keto reductase